MVFRTKSKHILTRGLKKGFSAKKYEDYSGRYLVILLVFSAVIITAIFGGKCYWYFRRKYYWYFRREILLLFSAGNITCICGR